jgi:hypothetical protein
MREAERQVQFGTLSLRTIANAHQGQLLLEALGDASYHVVQQRAHGARHGAAVGGALDSSAQQLFAIPFDSYRRQKELLQRSQRSLDRDFRFRQAHFDALGHINRILCNA